MLFDGLKSDQVWSLCYLNKLNWIEISMQLGMFPNHCWAIDLTDLATIGKLTSERQLKQIYCLIPSPIFAL
jgi:hypothetical protein